MAQVMRRLKLRLTPARTAVVYALLGAAWIVATDRAVEWMYGDEVPPLGVQTAKGILYIAVTTLLVYWLARKGRASALQEAEIHRARGDLRDARAFQSALVDASPLPLATLDTSGRVATWNPAAERVFGWPKDAVLGEPLPVVPPEREKEFGELTRRVLAGESVSDAHKAGRRKDETPADLSLSMAPIRDGAGDVVAVLAVISDVTERKRREAEQERLRQAVEQASDAVVVTDARGTIRYVNPAFERITGFTRQEAIGENPRILKSDEQDETFYAEMWRTIASGETWRGRFVNRRKDGRTYTADVSISPIRDAQGAIVDFVAVQRDVTRELDLESQLLQAQKMESIGRLAGGIAHDFNNMLTVILGNVDVVLDASPANAPHRGELEDVRAAALHSSALVGQLLGFARKQIIAPRRLDLNAEIEERIRMLRRLMGEDLDLRWRPASEPAPVFMDPIQIEQLLTNLLVNARDAIDGVGRVTIETAHVDVDEAYCADRLELRPGEYVRLAVTDTGRGMDKETSSRIFEPFYTTKPRERGTGLGLSTVYGIVKQNEGSINVYSEPGSGSAFHVYLRRRVDEGARPRRPRVRAEARRGSETILLVEDEAPLLKLAARQLESLGYTVLTASHPDDAIRLASAHEGAIDLLLTDVVLPEMNGRVLYEHLLQSRPGLACLYVSGYTADAVAHRGILEEGVHFLQKPFTAEALAAALREALDG